MLPHRKAKNWTSKGTNIVEPMGKDSLNVYLNYKKDQQLITSTKNRIKDTTMYALYVDGAANPNPGPAGIGYVICIERGERIFSDSMPIQEATNNVAEYCAIVYGLKTASILGIKKIKIYSDSDLAVNQINGRWKVSNDGLKPFYEEAKQLLSGFIHYEVCWISRESNTEADGLAKKGLRAEINPNDGKRPQQIVNNLDRERSNEPKVELHKDEMEIEERGKAANTVKNKKDQKTLHEFYIAKEKEQEERVIEEALKDYENFEKTKGNVEKALGERRSERITEEKITMNEDVVETLPPNLVKSDQLPYQRLPKLLTCPTELMLNNTCSISPPPFDSPNQIGTNIPRELSRSEAERFTNFFGQQLQNQEQRIWLLRDLNEQLARKTLELNNAVGSMMNYGSQSLEPWRNEVSMILQGVLGGAKELEERVYQTIDGCRELESIVSKQTTDLMNLKKENDELRDQVKNLTAQGEMNRKDIESLTTSLSKERDSTDNVVKQLGRTMKDFEQKQEFIRKGVDENLNKTRDMLIVELNKVNMRLDRLDSEEYKRSAASLADHATSEETKVHGKISKPRTILYEYKQGGQRYYTEDPMTQNGKLWYPANKDYYRIDRGVETNQYGKYGNKRDMTHGRGYYKEYRNFRPYNSEKPWFRTNNRDFQPFDQSTRTFQGLERKRSAFRPSGVKNYWDYNNYFPGKRGTPKDWRQSGWVY